MSLKHLIVSIFVIFSACAGKGECKHVKTPADYKILPVHVSGHKITGKDLDNVIKNHINARKYIKELKAIGCFKK